MSILILTALCLSGLALKAQDSRDEDKLPAGYTRDELGNVLPTSVYPLLSAETVNERIVLAKCPYYTLSLKSSYPDLTGDQKVDELIKMKFRQSINDRKALMLEDFGSGECPADAEADDDRGQSEQTTSFTAYGPSNRYLSVVYQTFEYASGAAHPDTSYQTETYLVGQGRVMTIFDLFQDPQKSIPQFWDYVGPKWCAYNKDYSALPSYYSSAGINLKCPAGGQAPPLPDVLKNADPSLAALGNPVFTAEGLTLVLGPYEGWSYADGPSSLNVPKDVLLKIGASPAIWQNGPAKQTTGLSGPKAK
ncbi:MAG: hypothetical protein LBP22_10015 [Deltaproteobacteria bacterium]|nr:hypothetical protein [Deltaproteobacteria bacterium]